MSLSQRELEYQAMRRFLRDLERADEGPAAKVAEAVNEELTARQRQVVHMYYLDQMVMHDIADKLGVSTSTVSRTIKRGRRRLQRCLRYGSQALLDASLRS